MAAACSLVFAGSGAGGVILYYYHMSFKNLFRLPELLLLFWITSAVLLLKWPSR